MAEMREHTPGTFSWVELATADQEGAKRFYSGLFGWNANDVPIGPDSYYTMLDQRGKNVGALYQLSEEQRTRGIAPHWLPYVTVSSADEMALQVKSLGGTVLAEPFDVFEFGRMLVIQDPTGGTLALWEARSHKGADLVNEPGAFCWNELATRDVERARAFYTGLFGWEPNVQPFEGTEYTSFTMHGQPVGGMIQMNEQWGEIPPHWMVYFAVEDCDRSAERARELGGEVKVPPTDIPGVGRFAVLQDPQGAVLSIIRLERTA